MKRVDIKYNFIHFNAPIKSLSHEKFNIVQQSGQFSVYCLNKMLRVPFSPK